jgi:hypothetical protein
MATTPVKVEVDQQSWLCTSTPPDITGADDSEVEWFVRVDRGVRRRLQPGDHLPIGHELVELFPASFVASAELGLTVCLSTPTAEVQARQEAERRRLLPRFAEVRSYVCLNCGETSPAAPPIEPAVQALDVASALEQATDEGGVEARARVQYHSFAQQRRRLVALAAADRIAGEFRRDHAQCDPSRELHPLEEMPEPDPSKPLPVWSGPVSHR